MVNEAHYQSLAYHPAYLVFEKTTQVIVPGPDVYNFNQHLNTKGKYYSTKYKSSGSKVWNPPSSQRFNKSSNKFLN